MITSYTLFKFLHVVSVIVWVGGIGTLTVLYTQLSRLQDRATLLALLRTSGFVGRVLTGPAAALTLIAGIVTAVSVGLDFGMLWLTWGFIGILASIVWGATFVRMTVAAIEKLLKAELEAELADSGPLQRLQRRLTLGNLVNLLILLSTVAVMVFKPA